MRVALGAFIALLLGLNIYWIVDNTTPFCWDQSWYMEISAELFYALKHSILTFAQQFTHSFSGLKAPLIAILPLPFYALLGVTEDVAMIPNLLEIIAFNVLLYALVRRKLGDKWALVAVLVTSTMPGFVVLSHHFLVEYGLATLVLLWIYLLLVSNGYRRWWVDVALGITLGLGLLMKLLFPLHALLPALVVFIMRLREDGKRGLPKALAQVGLLLLVGAAIAGTWYIRNWKTALGMGITSGFGAIAEDYAPGPVLEFSTMLLYWHNIINLHLSAYWFIVLALLVACAVILALVRRNRIRLDQFDLVCLCWFIVPFVVCTFGKNKDVRYFMPALATIGIAITLLLHRVLRRSRLRYAAVGLLALFPLATLLYLYTPTAVFNLDVRWHGLVLVRDKVTENKSTASAPRHEHWPIDEILTRLDLESEAPDNTLFLFADYPFLNISNLSNYRTVEHYDLKIKSAAYLGDGLNLDQLAEQVADSKFVLFKDGDQGIDFTNIYNPTALQAILQGQWPYHWVWSIALPDGSSAQVYQRTD